MRMELQSNLVVACQNGDLDGVRLALQGGARLSPSHPGEPSPLMYAAETGNADLVQFLLDAGAEVNYHDDTGSSALECAAISGSLSVTSVLLDRGASDEPNKDGALPSEYADHHGHPEVAQLIRRAASEKRGE